MFAPALVAQESLLKGILQTVDQVNEKALDLTALTDAEENQLGDSLLARVQKDFKSGGTKKFDVHGMFKKLRTYAKRTALKYECRIFRDTVFNAFAMAGGKTIVLTALLDSARDDNQLAFVLAHEIAHNDLKHCVRRVQYSARAENINPLLGNIVMVAYSVYRMPFSKDDEFAADALGVRIMEKAGYKREGAVSFFRILEQLESRYQMDQRDPLNDFISTHPLAKQRREAIEKMK